MDIKRCRMSPETAQGADGAPVAEQQDELEHQDSRSDAAPPARELDLTRHLVDDTLLAIFDLLSNSDLVSAGQVCRRWRSLAQRPWIWARRRVQLHSPPTNDTIASTQVVRILRFAPRLDEFDLPYRPYGPTHLPYRQGRLVPCLHEELLRKRIDTRCLRVRHPTPKLLQLYAGSVKELDVFAEHAFVLKIIATQCDSLQKLSLCFKKSRDGDDDLLKWLFIALQKHRLALHALILDLGRHRLSEQSTSRLMRALAQCPNLRTLDVVPLRLRAVDLRVLGSLPLERLKVRLPFKDLQGELRLPSSLRHVTVYFLRCPLRARTVRALARAFADLTGWPAAWTTVRLEQCGEWDGEEEDCDKGRALKSAIEPVVRMEYYCDCPTDCDSYDCWWL